MIIFWDIAYVVWLGLFSILRYAIVLEVLSGILIFEVLRKCIKKNIVKASFGAIFLMSAFAFSYGYPKWKSVSAETYLPVFSVSVADDSVLMVAEDLTAWIVPLIKTKNPVLGWTCSHFAQPMPYDEQIIKAYKEILAGKKIVLLTRTPKILDIVSYPQDLVDKNEIQYYDFLKNAWVPDLFIMAGKQDKAQMLHGFTVKPELLDLFLETMKAKSMTERRNSYYSKLKSSKE